MATLAATDLSSLIGRYRLNQATRELAKRVSECRMTAISENRECALRLLGADAGAGNGDWRANAGRYELHAADVATGTLQWAPLADGVVDFALGPGRQTGISIEPWTPLSGPAGLNMPDSVVFSPRGFAANRPTDFVSGGVIRVVLRNKQASFVEQRVVRIDRGGNVQIAVP